MVNSNMFVKNEDALFRTPSYAEEQLEHALKKEAEKATQEPKPDMVNHPSHYTQGEIEYLIPAGETELMRK